MENINTDLGKYLQEYMIGDFKCTMYIPSDLAGKVIGKKGIIITNLQRESKVKLINTLPAIGNSLWMGMVIIGELKNVLFAYQVIAELVEHEVDDAIMECIINKQKPFFLYGSKKYKTIYKISADSQTRIYLPELTLKDTASHKDTFHSNDSSAVMTFEGSIENIKTCIKLFDDEALQYNESKYSKVKKKISKNNEKSSQDSKNITKMISSNIDIVTNNENIDNTTTTNNNNNNNNIEDANNNIDSITTKIDPIESSSTLVVKIEKTLFIPSRLVGLLLSKGPKLKLTTVNLIQQLTSTIISKISNSTTTSTINNTNLDNSNSNNDTKRRRRRNTDTDDDDDDCDIEGDDVEDDQEELDDIAEVEVDNNNKDSSNKDNKFSFEDVLFRVIGAYEENVDVAIEYINRIIQGDRISIVLSELRVHSKTLQSTAATTNHVKNRKQSLPRNNMILHKKKNNNSNNNSINNNKLNNVQNDERNHEAVINDISKPFDGLDISKPFDGLETKKTYKVSNRYATKEGKWEKIHSNDIEKDKKK